MDLLAVLQVFEFGRVDIGDEEKVGAGAAGYGHGAGDGTDVGTNGGEETNFEAIDYFVEVLELFVLGGLVIVLFGDAGVGFGGDFFGG